MTARIAAVDRAAIGRVGGRLLDGPPSLAALGPVEGLEPYHRIQSRLAA